MSRVSQLSDEKLVVEIRKDKERFSELVERYENKLMKYATYLVHDRQTALDIVQESFIKTYINLNGFNTKKKFSSWIYRIVHNEAINHMKKYKKEIILTDSFYYATDQNVEEEYTKKEIAQQAQGCLQKMPVIYKEPLALYFLDDKSYDEISDILRIPMGTVATRINRGKIVMRNICKKNK